MLFMRECIPQKWIDHMILKDRSIAVIRKKELGKDNYE